MVKDGGTLILGPMSGYRDSTWSAFTDQAMGDLNTWTGIEVDARIPIGTEPRPAEPAIMLDLQEGFKGEETRAYLWGESLRSENGTVLARYKNSHAQRQACHHRKQGGKRQGRNTGDDPGRETTKEILLRYAKENDIEPLLSGPSGVLAVPREGKKT